MTNPYINENVDCDTSYKNPEFLIIGTLNKIKDPEKNLNGLNLFKDYLNGG